MGHMLIIVNLLHLYLKILVLLICLNISPAFKFKPNPLRGGGGCSLNSKTSVLNDWLIKEGLDKNDIKILFPGDGPAVALDTIKKGSTMLSIPMGIALDSSKALNKLPKVSAEKLKSGSIGLLALLILSEKYAGEKSKYFPYLNNLPVTAPGILSWNKEELDELYRSTTRKIESQINALDKDFLYVQSLQIFPLDFTRDTFFWAVGVAKGRSIFIQDLNKVVLIPGIDSVTFDPFSTAEPFLASAGVFGGKVIKVNADRNYNKDDEVYISFGIKSSAECLEDNGLVPDLMTDDSSCEIILSLEDTDKFMEDKLNILENESIDKKVQIDLESNSELEFDPLLMQFSRLKCIESRDAFILEACFSNTVWDTLSFPFSKQNEIKAVEYLIGVVNQHIDNMICLDSDAETSKENSRKGCMARLRIQERAALTQTLTKLSSDLEILKNGPDPREYYQERRLRELGLDRPLDEGEIVIAGERSSRPGDDDEY